MLCCLCKGGKKKESDRFSLFVLHQKRKKKKTLFQDERRRALLHAGVRGRPGRRGARQGDFVGEGLDVVAALGPGSSRRTSGRSRGRGVESIVGVRDGVAPASGLLDPAARLLVFSSRRLLSSPALERPAPRPRGPPRGSRNGPEAPRSLVPWRRRRRRGGGSGGSSSVGGSAGDGNGSKGVPPAAAAPGAASPAGEPAPEERCEFLDENCLVASDRDRRRRRRKRRRGRRKQPAAAASAAADLPFSVVVAAPLVAVLLLQRRQLR